MALTPRQKEVLDFIAEFVNQNGYCPSYEEIARGLGLASLATVHKHISALEARGYLIRTFNQSRSLELSQKYFNERPGARPAASSFEIPLAQHQHSRCARQRPRNPPLQSTPNPPSNPPSQNISLRFCFGLCSPFSLQISFSFARI